MNAAAPFESPETRVKELIEQAKEGHKALRNLARDFVRQAAANGAIYEELRQQFPPRSNWQAWVAEQVGVSVKTITRQRRLAEFVAENPGILDRLHPDVGVTAAYLLTARTTPKKAVLELVPRLEAEPISEAGIRRQIEQARQEERLAALDGRAYDLWIDGEVTLQQGLKMAENGAQWPEAVQGLIFTHAITNIEIYPILTQIWRYQPETFAELESSGTLWSSVQECPVPLAEASLTDWQLLLKEQSAEQFLHHLDVVADSQKHDEHRSRAKHIVNLSGRLEEIVPNLRDLNPDATYYVVVYEALSETNIV